MAKPSILSTIMRIESGGRNVPQSIDDINMRQGDPAQGYYQITGGTWGEFGGPKTGYKSAIDAPYPTQLAIAQNIPVARWGPATQAALRQAGYEPQSGETLGQMLARYGEDPNATRPEDVGGSSVGGGTAMASTTPDISGLLAQIFQQRQGLSSSAAGLLSPQDKLNQQTMAATQKLAQQGFGLLGEGIGSSPAAPAFSVDQGGVHRPQAQPVGNPDFVQMLAQQRLMQGV